MKAIKLLLFNIAGFAAVGLGIAGIFLPLLPTTPFLLLAAFCFLRGSRKFYLWLINHKILGRYIGDYLKHKMIPVKAKIYTLAVLWASIGFSSFLIRKLPVILVLTVIALAVSTHILTLRSRQSPGRPMKPSKSPGKKKR